ncbi:UNVERIFIED_CONTAM: hypothetical protein GTU68_059354 [Idotea baltica]|nr:hypothetical protein [Idotea baltica]
MLLQPLGHPRPLRLRRQIRLLLGLDRGKNLSQAGAPWQPHRPLSLASSLRTNPSHSVPGADLALGKRGARGRRNCRLMMSLDSVSHDKAFRKKTILLTSRDRLFM